MPSIWFCSGVVLYLALSHIGIFFKALHTLGQYAYPVFLGLVIAYVLNPLAEMFEGRIFGRIRSGTLKRTLSIMLSFISVIVFLALLIIMLVPQVIDSVSGLIGNLDTYSRALQQLIARLSNSANNWNIDLSGVEEAIRSALQAFTKAIPSNLQRIMNTSIHIGRAVFYGVIACIMAAYFLTEKEKILAAFKRLLTAILPDKAYRRSIVFLKKCNRIMSRYIVFDLLDGLIVGFANWIFMKVTGMSYAVLISVVIGVTNLAPTFGPIHPVHDPSADRGRILHQAEALRRPARHQRDLDPDLHHRRRKNVRRDRCPVLDPLHEIKPRDEES